MPSHQPLIDLSCAEAGRKAAKAAGPRSIDLFSSATSLLHERGLYSMFEFLDDAKHGNTKVAEVLFRFLDEHGRVSLAGAGTPLSKIITAFKDRLAEYIYAKRIMARCLDYAHAHGKAEAQRAKDATGSSHDSESQPAPTNESELKEPPSVNE